MKENKKETFRYNYLYNSRESLLLKNGGGESMIFFGTEKLLYWENQAKIKYLFFSP